jgi:hypothetical protein
MAWNFREWINTTVYGGAKWQAVVELGVKVVKADDEDEIPALMPIKKEGDEGDDDEGEAKNAEIFKIMGYSRTDVDYFQASTRFVNVLTGVVESNKLSAARQKLWNWMVKSLQGPKSNPGPYYYLVDEVAHSDVAALYQQLIRIIDTPTIVSSR